MTRKTFEEGMGHTPRPARCTQPRRPQGTGQGSHHAIFNHHQSRHSEGRGFAMNAHVQSLSWEFKKAPLGKGGWKLQGTLQERRRSCGQTPQEPGASGKELTGERP